MMARTAQGPTEWETLEGLARICEMTRADIVELTRSQLMGKAFLPFRQWGDRAAGDAGNAGRAPDQDKIRLLFQRRHILEQNSKYLRAGYDSSRWDRADHITAFLLRLHKRMTCDSQLFAGKVFQDNLRNVPQHEFMFTALYSLYRFKSNRSLASQHGRRRDRRGYEGLENSEQEEAENFEHYRFTPEEGVAKRARHFEDMEQNIADAFRLRAQEEESRLLKKALELSRMIAKARLWSTN